MCHQEKCQNCGRPTVRACVRACKRRMQGLCCCGGASHLRVCHALTQACVFFCLPLIYTLLFVECDALKIVVGRVWNACLDGIDGHPIRRSVRKTRKINFVFCVPQCELNVFIDCLDCHVLFSSCPNWQKGVHQPCQPGQQPTSLSSPRFLPSFFGSVVQVKQDENSS